MNLSGGVSAPGVEVKRTTLVDAICAVRRIAEAKPGVQRAEVFWRVGGYSARCIAGDLRGQTLAKARSLSQLAEALR